MDTTINTWLNADILESILKTKYCVDDISVTKFDITSGAVKGEGYLSDLNRVTVYFKKCVNGDFVSRNNSFIFKCLPLDPTRAEFATQSSAFIKELSAYNETIPKMEQVIKSKDTKLEYGQLYPRSFPCSRPNTLILEDLKELGFVLVDRRRGLDYAHSSLVVRSLAQFHAESIALYLEDPASMKVFAEGHYNEENRRAVGNFINSAFEGLIAQLQNMDGYKHFVDKLNKIRINAADYMIEAVKPRKGCTSVLNHGDMWINNLLFKYSPHSGNVEDVKFVDFQLCRFSSPALELQFFFHLNLHQEVFLNQREKLIEEYYTALRSYLEDLKCDPDLITLSELRDELKRTELFALITTCSRLWIVLSNPDDIGETMPFNFKKIYSDPLIKEAFKIYLSYFESIGIL